MSAHLSFEFFPPRDAEGQARLVENVAARLGQLQPELFSVTYGAGGSTRDGTRQTVEALLKAGHTTVPHLSMGTDDRESIHSLLDTYNALGVQHIVALRGDQPSGLSGNRFANNAEALITVIREHSGDQFQLIVAAYPEVHPDALGANKDLEFFKRKVDAGASAAITQYFYNVDAYEDFLERCTQNGIDIPIIPGIMPITNWASIKRFSTKAGAELPRWLSYRMEDIEENEQRVKEYGIEVVTKLCERLIGMGAPGFHFYTLNRWGATMRICENLNLGG